MKPFGPLDPSPAAASLTGAGVRAEAGVPEPRRRRGRPPRMTPHKLLDRIRLLARRPQSLFRVHLTHSSLYALARRRFGSWSEAVRAAGLDYDQAVSVARSRALKRRKRRARSRRSIGSGS